MTLAQRLERLGLRQIELIRFLERLTGRTVDHAMVSRWVSGKHKPSAALDALVRVIEEPHWLRRLNVSTTLETIREAYTEEFFYWRREFDWKDRTGGFSFPCDRNGKFLPGMAAAALANARECISGRYKPLMIDQGVVEYRGLHRHPRVVVCCRQRFELEGFTSTCPDCGADYNWSGQRLAARELWGEETGEHPADVARIA